MWHYAERPRKGPLIFSLTGCHPASTGPKTGVRRTLRCACTRANRRVNLGAFARFGVPIGKDGYANLPMARLIDSLKAYARARFLDYAGTRPPTTGAPIAIGLGHGVANQEVLRWAEHARALEPGAGDKRGPILALNLAV
jgi:hypothetical protein